MQDRGITARKLTGKLKHRQHVAGGAVGVAQAVLRAVADAFSAPFRSRGGLLWKPKSGSPSSVGVVCFGLVLLVSIVDYYTAPQVKLTLFYLLVIALAAWSGGRRVGIFIAVSSSLALLTHDFKGTRPHSPGWSFYWNLGMQIGIYLLAAMLVSAVHGLTESLERRVRERTTALEREIGERRLTEEQLRKTTQQFRQLAENITDAFWMRDASEMRMGYVSPAYETIWGRACRELYQSPQAWLDAIHSEDRERVAAAMFNKQSTGEYNQEYRIVRPDGALRWIRDRAFPIRDSSGKVIRVVGIAEDITDRRRLEREILEISDREQARLGQDLHDGLCQKLVSLAFDNNAMEQKLATRFAPEAVSVRQMGELLDELITEARALARGLFPVQLETNGLGLALEQLAASTSVRAKVDCVMDSLEPVTVGDNVMATHLYRIAQEAVNNAVKHARAGSIRIRLSSVNDRIELTVNDDGVGIPVTASSTGGMGLHIMNYRARTIGGTLDIERVPGGGTIVSCSVRQPSTGTET